MVNTESRPGAKVRLYHVFHRIFTSVRSAAEILHGGFWLGLLDTEDFHQLSRVFYTKGRYREEDYNHSGLADWEDQVLSRFFAGKTPILVAAAGGGRETLELARRGCCVYAFDCVPVLVESCRSLLAEYTDVNVKLAQPDVVPDYDIQFEGIIVGWGAYMHIPTFQRRLAFLAQLRRLIPTGAPLLLSFFTRSGDARRLRYIHNVGRFVRKFRRAEAPLEIGDNLSDTFDHHFTKEEIGHELEAAGFKMLEFTSHPYGHAMGAAI